MVGMSGGVDSSVAAALLLEKGYEVIGVTLKLWQGDEESVIEGGCCSLSAVDDARRVADKLQIPYYVLNFQDLFKEKVIEYFKEQYLEGKTPNPCIACNKFIKFDAMLNKATSMGIDYIATGHYAKITFDEQRKMYILRKSDADKKDQTYVLYNLTQDQLQRTLMPLGEYDKKRVREIAQELGLVRVASKPDSQEICFVPDNDYGRYIESNTENKVSSGYFVDVNGKRLGKHKGIVHYTVGQRKGLGIAFGKPMFVARIDAKNNTVVLGEESEVFGKELNAKDVNYCVNNDIKMPTKISAKIRYSAKDAPAILYPMDGKKAKVIFDTPQRAITPGQSVVFYDGDIVLGGGIIE